MPCRAISDIPRETWVVQLIGVDGTIENGSGSLVDVKMSRENKVDGVLV